MVDCLEHVGNESSSPRHAGNGRQRRGPRRAQARGNEDNNLATSCTRYLSRKYDEPAGCLYSLLLLDTILPSYQAAPRGALVRCSSAGVVKCI